MLGVHLAGDAGVQVGPGRQRPEAEHVEELPPQLGALPFPVGARFDAGEGGVGDALGFLAKIGIADAVAAGGVRGANRH